MSRADRLPFGKRHMHMPCEGSKCNAVFRCFDHLFAMPMVAFSYLFVCFPSFVVRVFNLSHRAPAHARSPRLMLIALEDVILY